MSGTIQNNIITVRQGDSFEINLQIKDGCKPVNVTGATLKMQVRDEGGNVVFEVTGTPVDTANGKMVLLITPAETNVQVGEYVTDIQLTSANGHVDTIFPPDVNKIGVFRITPQVTEG